MDNTWVLVANASEAHLYATERLGEKMSILKDFSHPDSRVKGEALTTDRAGNSRGMGSSSGTRGDPAAHKDIEANRFANELANELDKGRLENAYRRLVLVASPHFHGLLNTNMNEHTKAMVASNINKDFTTCNARDLPVRLKECM